MREIKFRGKNTDTKEWVYGDLYSTSEIPMIVVNGIASEYENFVVVIPETVGQYTGLEDDDGNEIYEGDLIKHRNPKPFKDAIYEVIFLNGGFAIKNDDYIGDLNEYLKNGRSHKTIIGNKYQNPDLLK